MTAPHNPDYACPRCNYQTRFKNDMRRHLYKNKRSCPAHLNKIELTDMVKSEIMQNRVYEVAMNQNSTINLNNIILDMDTKDKLETSLTWDNKHVVNFGDQVEQTHEQKIKKLDDRSYRYGFKLDHNNLYDIVDQSVQIKSKSDLPKFNILYISELNKIAVYHDDEWATFLFDSGINQIVNIIRNYYLESYEKYILYKIFVDKNIGAFECNIFKNQLNDYFKFLVPFSIYPSCKDEKNVDIVSNFKHDNVFYLSDFCMMRYNEQKDELKKADLAKTRKMVGDIVKRNSGTNVKILNKHVIDLAVNDSNFKTKLLAISERSN